jgi:hypothetical protein
MTQLTFAFATQPKIGQLELFSETVYDNRVSRVGYAIKISHNVNRWRPNTIDNVKECVRLFGVNHETVFRLYDELITGAWQRHLNSESQVV